MNEYSDMLRSRRPIAIGRRALVGALLLALSGVAFASDAESRRYFTSPEHADAVFESALLRLGESGVPDQPFDPKLLPSASARHQDTVRGIKKGWDKNFDHADKVIDLQEKPPPPPNGLFKAAEKGKGFIKVKKKKNGKRGKKSKKGKRRR